MILKHFKEDSISLIISLVLVIISFMMELFSNYGINKKHVFGLITIVISIYTYLKDKKIYIYTFLTTLFLGLFSFIDFFFLEFDFVFGLGDVLKINLNPQFIFLLILFLILNKNLINQKLE